MCGKLFLVSGLDYDGCQHEGLYKSYEKALEAKERGEGDNPGLVWEVEEFNVR